MRSVDRYPLTRTVAIWVHYISHL